MTLHEHGKYRCLTPSCNHVTKVLITSNFFLGEEYRATFPSGYGRSILTVPWVELGGKVDLGCEKTGYSAVIEFKCKQFFR